VHVGVHGEEGGVLEVAELEDVRVEGGEEMRDCGEARVAIE
jgi:hypothetical protein